MPVLDAIELPKQTQGLKPPQPLQVRLEMFYLRTRAWRTKGNTGFRIQAVSKKKDFPVIFAILIGVAGRSANLGGGHRYWRH